MTVPMPPAGDHYRAPAAFPAYTVPSPSGPVSPPPSRPSWVAWAALGLSALSLVVATSVGIIYAANSLTGSGAAAGADTSEGAEFYYDAGMPSLGSVELTENGDVEAFTLQDSLDRYLKEGIEEFGGRAEDVSDVTCEAIVQPKRNSVGTCSLTVEGYDSHVVVFFLNDEGAYLATLY